jgi:hypothetical protein
VAELRAPEEPRGRARNAPCACGCGRKAKRCPGLLDAAVLRAFPGHSAEARFRTRGRVCPLCLEVSAMEGRPWCPATHGGRPLGWRFRVLKPPSAYRIHGDRMSYRYRTPAGILLGTLVGRWPL